MLLNRHQSTNKYGIFFEFLVGIILLLFGILVIREARKLSLGGVHAPGPGFFPFWLGCGFVILSLILLFGLLSRKIKVAKGQWGEVLWHKVAFSSIVLFVYCLVLESIGYLIGTFLLLGILFRLIEKKNISVVFGLSGFISLGTYFLFKYWLFIQLPKGIIPF